MGDLPESNNRVKNVLHVIDANCSWIRSLVDAMPPDWHVRNYRIYNPQWLPGGKADLLRVFRPRYLSETSDEVFCVVPGWNKHPVASAWIVQLWMWQSLARNLQGSAVLFTFPFYSGVAAWVRRRFPAVKVFYHAHDPFEFYSYPAGYIRTHEDRLVPLCHRVLAISERLASDFCERYPSARVTRLGNATSIDFLEFRARSVPDKVEEIRSAGRTVVGCIGQINSSYDWDLLEDAATVNLSTQFVFVGNLFEEEGMTRRIRAFFERPNVHWLGPVPHAELPSYMAAFDICLNPLAVTAQNDRRDTLRLYDYLTTDRPVYSTAIDGAKIHREHVEVFTNQAEMTRALGSVPRALDSDRLAARRRYVAGNTWNARAMDLVAALNR